MLKQRNRNVLAILTFELTIGPATFEWIPIWLRHVHTAIWVPILLYVGIGVVLIWLLTEVTFRDNRLDTRLLTAFDGVFHRRWLRWVVHGTLLITSVVYGSMVLRISMNLIKYIALPSTPMISIACLAMLIPVQLFRGGLDSVLRYEITLFWPTTVIGVLMLLLCFEVSDMSNLLPLWPVSWSDIIDLLPQWIYLCWGVLLLTMYLPIFRSAGADKRSVLWMAILGFLGAVLLQTLNVFVVLADFGAYEGASLNWPVFEAIRIQHYGRWTVLFLLPVLTAVSSAINLSTYAAYRLVAYYLRSRTALATIGLCSVVVLLSLRPPSMRTVLSAYVAVIDAATVFLGALLTVIALTMAFRGRVS